MPYIAFDLDALAHLPSAARAANLDEGCIALGLVRMWEWCWRKKTDVLTAVQVRGFFGVVVESGLAEALAGFGFLEAVDGGFRARGADRYLRVRKARSAGGHAAKGNLKQGTKAPPQPQVLSLPPAPPPPPAEVPSSPAQFESSPAQAGKVSASGPALTASSEQRTASNYVRSTCGEASEAAAPPEVEQRRPVAPVTPPETPPEEWDAWDFWRWAQARREASGFMPERPPHPRKLSAWWSEALGMVPEPGRLKEAFYRFGDDKFWGKADPPYPFGGFMTQWERFAPPAEVAE